MYWAAVLLVPVQVIDVAFATCDQGDGTEQRPGDKPQQTLMDYLNKTTTLNTRTSGSDPFVISGTDQQGTVAYYAVYTGTTQQFLKTALSTTNAIIIVEGHSNCGIGPAFPGDNIQHIQDFFNIGDPYTGAWLDDGALTNEYPNLNVAESEIAQSPTNYNVAVLNILKYTNNEGIGVSGTFTLDSGNPYPTHYSCTVPDTDNKDTGTQIALFTIVKAGAADLPTPCYKAFFWDGCYTGRDYIGEFQHGVFFYTTGYGGDPDSTADFITQIINGNSWTQVLNYLNTNDADATHGYTYGCHQ